MIAVEIETLIVDHQINISSDRLPAQVRRAKVIVLFDEAETDMPCQGPLANLRANPAPIKGDGYPMKREELYERDSIR